MEYSLLSKMKTDQFEEPIAMKVHGKIRSLEALAQELEILRSRNKKIVHCHGVFDLLHVGHLRYFQEAKMMGDVLIVTLTPDRFVNKGPMRPVFTESHRAEMIASLDIVDYVVINEWPTAEETIRCLKPHIYVKGPDYRDHRNDLTGKIKEEEESVRSVDGEIRYTNDITFSSSALLNQNFPIYTKEQMEYLDRIKGKYSAHAIREYLDRLSSLRVLLIGEAIIDEYVFCNAIGKSAKEPMLVMQKLQTETYAGGVLAIANHLSDFCQKITIASFVGHGQDRNDFVLNHLKPNVHLDCITKSNSPTLVKRRYVDAYTKSKLFGVYEINDEIITKAEEDLFISKLEKQLPDHDIVLIADYGHGLISDKIVELLMRQKKFLAVNTQVNASNIGYHTISKYPRADYVCIHEGELRHEYRTRTKDEKILIQELYRRMGCETVVMTRGVKGALAYREEEGFLSCPPFANKVVDRIGAGDTLLAITSAAFGAGLPTDLSLLLGNLAAAEKVGVMGTGQAISKIGLLKSIDTLLK
ncbi:MAG: adenylyltransferase/cytidyltransferase family protein [Chlamydiae bacterium]|nr:adenylyltransferase/cytidyltransferase family protein [Chlamydiota bacterium]MBI3267044.1 adenylyltransferase/cytidyltransferase family protein [Chlamydiota bacterium]